MARSDEKILCKTPVPAKAPTRIPIWKYDAVRTAILQLVKQEIEVYFTDRPQKVGALLNAPDRADIGSLAWHVTTVKLQMEARRRNLPAARKRSPAPCGGLTPAGFHLPPTAHKLNP